MKLPVTWKLPCGAVVTVADDNLGFRILVVDLDRDFWIHKASARFLARKLARMFPAKRTRKGKR